MTETLHEHLENEGFLVRGIYSTEDFSENLASFAVENSREKYKEIYVCKLERALAGEYSVEGDFQIIYHKPSEKIARVGEKFLQRQKKKSLGIMLKRESDQSLCIPLNINGRLQFT
jgi:hypothetical protein